MTSQLTNRSGQLNTWLGLALVILPLASGCGSGKKGKIWVYRYPAFYQSELKQVAVLPFGNRTGSAGIGQRMSDKVSAVLTNNGTYDVYTRQHLKDILAEKDLALSGIIDADEAKRIGRLKSVQALVCGVCNRCDSTTRNETRYNNVAIWGYNAKGERVITGWKKVPYQWTRHDAFVECNVVVIDTGTGQQLTAVHDPSHTWAQGSPPKYTAHDTTITAEEDQVNRIVRAIAITRTQINLKGEVVQTATDLYDQEWDWQRRLIPEDDHFFIVVQLPSEAERNNFKITIVPKDERNIVAEHAFVWTNKYKRFGYKFNLKPIIDKQGFGEYQAKLYSGSQPIAWYNFSIVEKR